MGLDKMKKRIIFGVILLLVLHFTTGVLSFQPSENVLTAAATEAQTSYADIPRTGTVTMLDLGADKCIPCKMMAPIIEKLKKDYNGKADIVFIDVWKNPGQGERFKISSIPTQIFFDKDGKEVSRHVGFLKEAAIVEKLKELGVK
jgi:thioredoxin 1